MVRHRGGLFKTNLRVAVSYRCDRVIAADDEIKIDFRVPPEYPTPNFAPSWNVAPTDNLPIVRYNPKAGHRTLDLMRWGLFEAAIVVPQCGNDPGAVELECSPARKCTFSVPIHRPSLTLV